MKLFAIRSAAAAALLSLLTACGGSDFEASTPVADAATPAGPVIDSPSASDALAAVEPPPSNGQNPTPDCQPENCQGLRIIDGNAEAYRHDAMARSAADAGSPT